VANGRFWKAKTRWQLSGNELAKRSGISLPIPSIRRPVLAAAKQLRARGFNLDQVSLNAAVVADSL